MVKGVPIHTAGPFQRTADVRRSGFSDSRYKALLCGDVTPGGRVRPSSFNNGSSHRGLTEVRSPEREFVSTGNGAACENRGSTMSCTERDMLFRKLGERCHHPRTSRGLRGPGSFSHHSSCQA